MQNLKSYLALILFSILIFIPGIATLPVIDRDEAHFAQASRQMLQTGNYFQIRFQDKTRFQKPPGINWLQAAAVKVFTNAEASTIWPYRIPSLLGALLSVLLTYFFSRRFINETTAKLAAALLAATLLLVVEAHMAVIDTSLLSSVLLAQGALWMIYHNKQATWGWALCFWLAMSYGFVLKGVTPLVGVLTIITLCCIDRRLDWLRNLHILSGLSLFVLLTLAWVLMVNQAENSNYLMQMIHKDLLPKLQGGHESHGKPPLFHLLILPLTFWPSSLFLWQGGVFAFRQRHVKTVKFLLSWILPTWLFFEIMPTKLPQYVLPTFPAIAILCAMALCEIKQKIKPGKVLRILQILWGLLSIGLALSLAILPYLLVGRFTPVALVLFAEITILTCIALYYARQGFFQKASLVVLLMALLTYPIVFKIFFPKLETLWISKRVAQQVEKHQLSEEKPLLVVGFEEPSLVFNLNTHLLQFTDANTAELLMKADPSRLAVIDSSLFNNWRSAFILEKFQGYNYSKGRWLTLYLAGLKKSEEN